VARRGLRLGDMLYPERFAEKLKEVLEYHNFTLTQYYKVEAIDYDKTLADCLAMAEQIVPMIEDVTETLHTLREAGENIMFEGAQGTLLDIDHGTYPFVTSSNTTAGGVSSGSGVGPLYLDYVLGITKAYTTRVGGGPFPTELFDDVGQGLGERGHEFGATTGRERRCGWFDAMLVRHAVRINSVSGICLTKLDVLDGMDTIKICVGYQDDAGNTIGQPADAEAYAALTPVYEEMPGWSESTFGAKLMTELPANAIAYVKRLEELVGAPIDIVSTGPDRIETIVLRDPYDA
jgi:adenylosuccinate synthase